MNRRQRRAHAFLWPVLMCLMAAVCIAALATKSHLDRAIAAVSTR